MTMQEVSTIFQRPAESLPLALSIRQPSCHSKVSFSNEEIHLCCIGESTGSAATTALFKSKTGTVVIGATCGCSAFMCNLLCGHITAVVRAWLTQPEVFVRSTSRPWPGAALTAATTSTAAPSTPSQQGGVTWMETGRVADCYSTALDRHKVDLHKAVAAACARHAGLLPAALHPTQPPAGNTHTLAKASASGAATARQPSTSARQR